LQSFNRGGRRAFPGFEHIIPRFIRSVQHAKTKYDYYDDHFKATAVALGELPGTQAKQVAELLDIHPVMLYRWKKEVCDGVIIKKSDKGSLDNAQAKELKRLKKVEKDYERLQMEHELLKKASNTVRIKKRDPPVHRVFERDLPTQTNV